MDLQFFSGRGCNSERIFLPRSFRRNVKWMPKIGDLFPNFEASSTEGCLRFYNWAEGQWSVIFSHPAAFTPVCTSEIVALAEARDDFAANGVKLLAISRSAVMEQYKWFRDVEKSYGVTIDFPGVEDVSGCLSDAFGFLHPKELPECPIRKCFVLDPEMRIRMIFEYPAMIGRSTDELLRCIFALQIQAREGVATPADWYPGEKVISFPPANRNKVPRAIASNEG